MDFSRLALIRKKKELTQRETAKILNVSKSTYARWETTEQIIPLIHLNNFCNHFKVSMDYVLKLTNINNFYKYNYFKTINKFKIGKNIKLIRKKYNLTQNDLAILLNTSQSTISGYESGKTLVLTAFIYELATKLNLSVDEICGKLFIKKIVKL